MNNTEMIQVLTENTGENFETCNAVVRGFETASQDALENKWRSRANTEQEIIEMASAYSQVDVETCSKIIPVLKEQISFKMSDKLRFLKRKQK